MRSREPALRGSTAAARAESCGSGVCAPFGDGAHALDLATSQAARPSSPPKADTARLSGGGPCCWNPRVSGGLLLPLAQQVQRDVDDHVLLATDEAASADLDEEVPGIDPVLLRGALRVP